MMVAAVSPVTNSWHPKPWVKKILEAFSFHAKKENALLITISVCAATFGCSSYILDAPLSRSDTLENRAMTV